MKPGWEQTVTGGTRAFPVLTADRREVSRRADTSQSIRTAEMGKWLKRASLPTGNPSAQILGVVSYQAQGNGDQSGGWLHTQ